MAHWSRIVAGLSGCSAVGMGAVGAHKFKPNDPYFAIVFQRANNYHILHSFLIGMAPLARYPSAVAGLGTAGVCLFSGSCYAVALKEDSSLSYGAPFGGIALMCAWLALAVP